MYFYLFAVDLTSTTIIATHDIIKSVMIWDCENLWWRKVTKVLQSEGTCMITPTKNFLKQPTKLDIVWWCCTWSKFPVEVGTSNCFLIFNHTSHLVDTFSATLCMVCNQKKSFRIYYANFIGARLFIMWAPTNENKTCILCMLYNCDNFVILWLYVDLRQLWLSSNTILTNFSCLLSHTCTGDQYYCNM